MAKYRTRPIHPIIQLAMDKQQCGSLTALSEKTGISTTMLSKYANGLDGFGPEVKALLESAEKIANKCGSKVSKTDVVMALLELTA